MNLLNKIHAVKVAHYFENIFKSENQSKSDDLIKFSKSPIAMAPAYCFWLAECLEVLLMVFWMMFAIFLVAWDKTSFIFYVIGCPSPKYFEADWAAFAYELSEAWYYKNSKHIGEGGLLIWGILIRLQYCGKRYTVQSNDLQVSSAVAGLLHSLSCLPWWGLMTDCLWICWPARLESKLKPS